MADVIKLDHLALGPERFAAQVELLKPYSASVLAEKVETKMRTSSVGRSAATSSRVSSTRRRSCCTSAGIELRAGSILQVISALQNTDLQFDELEPLIAHDLPLSLRLLRYINSAFFGLRHEVTSVRQALVLLGIENVRQWATLTVIGSIEGKTPGADVDRADPRALLRARRVEPPGWTDRRSSRSACSR